MVTDICEPLSVRTERAIFSNRIYITGKLVCVEKDNNCFRYGIELDHQSDFSDKIVFFNLNELVFDEDTKNIWICKKNVNQCSHICSVRNVEVDRSAGKTIAPCRDEYIYNAKPVE